MRLVGQKIIDFIVRVVPYFGFIRQKQSPTQHITFRMWYKQKVIGYNAASYWPVSHRSIVVNPANIYVGKGSFPGSMPGCYIQGLGKIYIGNYSIFAANVGIISGNHSVGNVESYELSSVRIGSYCWVGMNAVILPGVTLGDFTVVGAGAVVTKSFPEGFCIIGGNPAKIIKQIPREDCKKITFDKCKYHGYILESKFDLYRKRYLKV